LKKRTSPLTCSKNPLTGSTSTTTTWKSWVTLHYLRTKEKKEVDFALAVEDQPTTLIEVKLSDSELSPALKYFHEKYNLPAVQVVRHLRQERMAGDIPIRRALAFLRELR